MAGAKVPAVKNNNPSASKMPMKIISVVGARPNFMKIAPFCAALKKYPDI